MKLSIKISALFLFVVIIASLTMATIFYFVLRERALNDASVRLELTASKIGNRLDHFIEERNFALTSISKDAVLSSKDSTPLQLRKSLIAFRNSMKLFGTISLFTPNRLRLSDSNGLDIGDTAPTNLWPKDFSTKKNGVSDKVSMSQCLRLPAIFGFLNILDKDHKVFRIIQIVTPLSVLNGKIIETIESSNYMRGARIELVQMDGLIIYSNFSRAEVLKKRIDLNALLKDVALGNKPSSIILYNDSSKERLLKTFYKIRGFLTPAQGWILSVSIPEKIVLMPVYKTTLIIIAVSIFVIFIFLIPILLLGHRISSPVRTLAQAARKIGKGEYGEKVQLNSSDEIGVLGRAFNEMSENLLKAREQIKVYSERLEGLVEARTKELNSVVRELQTRNLELSTAKNNLEALSKTLDDKVREKTFYLIRERQKLLTAQGITHCAVFEYDIIGDSFIWAEGGNSKILDICFANNAKTMQAIFALILPEDLERFKDECDLALTTGEINETYRVISYDKEVKWIKVVSKIYYLENNQPSMSLGAISDVTEQIQALKELITLQEQLFQSQKMEVVGSLASGISYDFTKIISNIVGLADLILESEKNVRPEAIALLEEIKKQGKKGADIAKQILGFSLSKTEALIPIDLMELAQRTLKILHSSLYEVGEVTLKKITEKPPMINGNEMQIQQLFMNICANSRDAMQGKRGRISVTIDEVTLDAEFAVKNKIRKGSYVKLTIEDTGHGMSDEMQKKIFEPFFTTKNGKGTGLGLSIVKRAVENHKGAIQIESHVGVGTTISIYFPILIT